MNSQKVGHNSYDGNITYAMTQHIEYSFSTPLLGQKSGTGTVMILIEDVNDNTPVISNLTPSICNKGAAQNSVVINASDLDQQPYSYPFLFELVKPNDGSWRLKDQKGMSRILGDL